MAEFQAGEVVVPVVPDATGFHKDLKKSLVPGAYKLGQDIGKEIGRGIKDSLRGVYEPLQRETRQQQQRAPREGAAVGGAFARGVKSSLEAAFKSLPKIELDAESSEAQRKIQDLRARIETLSGKTIGIDVDAGTAQAEVAAIQRELAALDGESVSVDVRADVASALGQLATVQGALSGVDGRTAQARVDVDVAGALASIGTVAAAIAALSAIPVGATLAAGIGALSGPLAAAGAGFAGLAAVAGPSVGRINEALKEQEKAAGAAATATVSGAQKAAQAAQAAYSLEQAERRVVDAKKSAQQAEQDLTRAREDAKRAMDQLRRSVEDAALAEEDAALSVEEARQRLAEVQADPESSDLEIQRAELAVRQAEQAHKNAIARNKDLRKQQKDADKAGVEGSDQVKRAKEQLAAANQRVKDSESQLKILRLQQVAADKAGAAAAGGVASKMRELSPAAQAAARQIKAFQDAYLGWQQKLEPAVLPAVTGGLKVIQGLFKPLTPLVKGTAGALVELEKSASKALGGGFWQGFFKDLSTAAPTAVTGLGKSLGNVATGVAGVIRAFLPFTGTVVGGIEKATAAFSRWGQGLKNSEGFKSFIAYVKQAIPPVLEIFRNLWTLGKNVVVALAPLGGPALAGLSGLTGVLASLSPQTLLAIATGIGTIAAGVKAWSISQTILNTVMKAGPFGVILTIVGLLVAAITYAWQNSETFRNVVTAVWTAISTAVQWAWTNVIQPTVQALVDFWNNVLAPVFTWLWQNIIMPAWQGIQAVITAAWNNVILPAVQAGYNFFKTVLAPVFTWLWNTIVKPAFAGIGIIVKAAWENVIKPALQAGHNFLKTVLGPVFTWLWKNIITPAWDGIKVVVTTVWEKFLKPVFDKLYDVIFKTIPDAFKKGVEFIKTAWDKVKEVAKAPVKFIVDVVYNNGIVKVWNAVADFLKLPKLSPLAFAKGGVMPGYTPGRDVALAAVSGGEAIMRPEWTRAVGEDYVHRMNSAARKGGVAGVARALGVAGDPGFAGAFAEGGIIGDIKSILSTGIKIGAEKLLNPLLDSAARAMGDAPWAKMLTNIPKQMVAGVIKLLGDKEESAGGGKAVAYARQQIGKPYVWGGTGPDGFDCSGLTSQAWKHAGVADIPRVSQDQMKWVKPVQTPRPGDLGFPHSGHVWMYSSPDTIIEAPYTGAYVREVAARAAELIGRPPQMFASGGIVRYARGGIRPKAHITDRPTVLYGEAGPEAYIPLGGGMRRRGLEVLGQAAAAMGQVVLPTSALAGGGYLEALQSAALMATGGIIPPTGSGSAGSAAAGQVAGVVSRSSSSISTTLVKSSQVLKQALTAGTTTLSGAVGDAWQRASAGLTTTSTTLSQAASRAAATTSTSINQVAEAEIAASSKLVTATTDLGTTVSKATGELKATLVQVASSATKGATATAAKPATPEAPGTPAAKAAAKATKNTVGGTTSGIVQLILFEDQDIPSRVGPTSYDAGGMLVPGTSLVHNGTGRPERVLTDRQWQDIQGGGSGGGPLLQIDEFNATPEQSPRAIAGELKYLLGSQLRMR